MKCQNCGKEMVILRRGSNEIFVCANYPNCILSVELKNVKDWTIKEKNEDGILRIVCPNCDYQFKFRRGYRRYPSLQEVGDWCFRARCPKCGTKF